MAASVENSRKIVDTPCENVDNPRAVPTASTFRSKIILRARTRALFFAPARQMI